MAKRRLTVNSRFLALRVACNHYRRRWKAVFGSKSVKVDDPAARKKWVASLRNDQEIGDLYYSSYKADLYESLIWFLKECDGDAYVDFANHWQVDSSDPPAVQFRRFDKVRREHGLL